MIELSIDSIIVKTYVPTEAGSIINGNHIQLNKMWAVQCVLVYIIYCTGTE